MHRLVRVVVIAMTVLGATPIGAVMLCAKKSGAVALRETCGKKETPLDVSLLGLQGPNGDPGPKGDIATTGPAGGDLAGSYPNPTLRPPTEVGIKPHFDRFCGNADIDVGNSSNYWRNPTF